MTCSRSSAAGRRSRPYGCLVGGLAGLAAVSLLMPATALRADTPWLLGVLAGAGIGFAAQVTLRRLAAGRRRRQPLAERAARPSLTGVRSSRGRADSGTAAGGGEEDR